MRLFSAFGIRAGKLLASALLALTTSLPLYATKVTITVTDNQYTPANVTAQPGDTIVFNLTGLGSHPTVSDNGDWATLRLDAGRRTNSVVLTTPKVYPYFCSNHGGPGGIGMSGRITIQGATGVRPELIRPELSAFPNPTSTARHGEVTISFNPKATAAVDARIRLLNVIGRVVRESPLRRTATEGQVTFSVADLPAGVYFYSLLSGDRALETKRLIVQP